MYSSKKAPIEDLTDQDKLESIQYHFYKIMEALGLDLDDESLKKTPERVAKMYVNEVFRGLNEKNFPKISFFDNSTNYKDMILVDNITMFSYCEHHFVPFFGKVAVAYMPKDRVIGLSKINRIVQFIASKPQIQEKLTVEIGQKLSELLKTDDVAVFIEATHLCVASRGVRDEKSVTKTNFFSGKFLKDKMRTRFINALGK
ncbi:GTP cyclohydrolase I FolE [Gelidibacter gilvus]|uniref:GTP cyclohydrolase 1 n=2 Tax=Gelidibacter gilvus TaxID=59602 RepID=A0A4Q0XGW3_9FLAO|nr:GTP cyclohydrolase I FolE [Gelidibacter gilvus]